MMAPCIYCANVADSEEHHLPCALGNFKGYVALLDRLCRVCNKSCGELDEQLSRTGIEAWHRVRLGITGRKSHGKVDPFYRGSAGGKAIEMTATRPSTAREVHLRLTGPNKVEELRSVTLTDEGGADYFIRIPDGMAKEQFRKLVAELPVKTFKTIDICAGDEDVAWTEELVRSAISFDKPLEWEHSALGPVFYGAVRVKVRGDSRYFRCIAKIGFHYFLTKVTQFRGDEGCFAGIRDFIIKGVANIRDCERFVGVACSPLEGVEHLKQPGHILSAEKHGARLTTRVQLFAGPVSHGRVYRVELGTDPSPILYNEWHGDFFGYYPERAPGGEFDGEVVELSRISACNT